MKKMTVFLLLTLMVWVSISGCKGKSDASGAKTVTIEFIQWWEPELPSGSFRAIMDEFEAQNPGIKVKLISGPYNTIRDQIIASAATGTLSDVVGLDGAWVNDLAKKGGITPLDGFVSPSNFDTSQVAAIINVEGKSYMYTVASYVYPIFINLDHFQRAGIEGLPQNRTEFAQAARILTNASENIYGWVLPLSLQTPQTVQNDMMSWVWSSGKSMLKDGRPDLTNSDVIDLLRFVNELYKEGVIAPGSFSQVEQDKVEMFVNGRVGMAISSLAHINMIRERNPNLNFTISAIPAVDGYTGRRGLPYAAWGIGISEKSKYKEEAWKLVTYLVSTEVNSKLVSIAHGFPGNVHAKPDYVDSDPMYAKAFEIFKTGYLANEFTGLPVAEELMRSFEEEIQLMLDGKQTPEEAAAKAQEKWAKVF